MFELFLACAFVLDNKPSATPHVIVVIHQKNTGHLIQ